MLYNNLYGSHIHSNEGNKYILFVFCQKIVWGSSLPEGFSLDSGNYDSVESPLLTTKL